MRRPLDGPRRITGTTASHAEYGVGPATDYGADTGEPIFAPFEGTIDRWWSDTGGWTVRVTNGGLRWIGQHLSGYRGPTGVTVGEGALIGVVGSTGSMSDAPHLHNWIECPYRISMEDYLAGLGWATAPLWGVVSGPSFAGGSSRPFPESKQQEDDMSDGGAWLRINEGEKYEGRIYQQAVPATPLVRVNSDEWTGYGNNGNRFVNTTFAAVESLIKEVGRRDRVTGTISHDFD